MVSLESSTRERGDEERQTSDGAGEQKRFALDDRARATTAALAISALSSPSLSRRLLPGALFTSRTPSGNASISPRAPSTERLLSEASPSGDVGEAECRSPTERRSAANRSRRRPLSPAARAPSCGHAVEPSFTLRFKSFALCCDDALRWSRPSPAATQDAAFSSLLSSTARDAPAAAAALDCFFTHLLSLSSPLLRTQPTNRTQACKFSGLKIYPGRGIHFIKTDSQVSFGVLGFPFDRRQARKASMQVLLRLALSRSLRSSFRSPFRILILAGGLQDSRVVAVTCYRRRSGHGARIRQHFLERKNKKLTLLPLPPTSLSRPLPSKKKKNSKINTAIPLHQPQGQVPLRPAQEGRQDRLDHHLPQGPQEGPRRHGCPQEAPLGDQGHCPRHRRRLARGHQQAARREARGSQGVEGGRDPRGEGEGEEDARREGGVEGRRRGRGQGGQGGQGRVRSGAGDPWQALRNGR